MTQFVHGSGGHRTYECKAANAEIYLGLDKQAQSLKGMARSPEFDYFVVNFVSKVTCQLRPPTHQAHCKVKEIGHELVL
jgi:hypothetical protein